MNVCIVGNGLTSLSLAKNLINKKINVHIYEENKIVNLISSRTIGVSKKNLDFFKKEILNLSNRDIWEIKKIEIYSHKIKNNKILNFEENSNLFYMIKNDLLLKKLNTQLLKSKFFKKTNIKDNLFFEKEINNKKYDLIINCQQNNYFAKKYFSKKISKDYKNIAYTSIIEHQKLDNNTAVQIFSKFGPIAFLPISNKKTSVVCSLETKNKTYTKSEVLDLINDNNPKFKIKKISELDSFELKSTNLRTYYFKNILAFGDLLHRIHPLAGQGFNMSIRDIKIFSEIVQNKIDLGIQLDELVLEEFEKKTRHTNLIFSSGIDFIYEFFNFDKKSKNKNLNKILRYVGKNKNINDAFIKLANNGLNIY